MNFDQHVPLYTSEEIHQRQQQKKKARAIPPERRKKVAQACDSCKRRKQKCNGLVPCAICVQKSFKCEYTAIDRRVLKPAKKELEERRKAELNLSRNTASQDQNIETSTSSAVPYPEVGTNKRSVAGSPVQWDLQNQHGELLRHCESQSLQYHQTAPKNYTLSEDQNSSIHLTERAYSPAIRSAPPAETYSMSAKQSRSARLQHYPQDAKDKPQFTTPQYGKQPLKQDSQKSSSSMPLLSFPVNIFDTDDSYNEAVVPTEDGQYSRILFDNCGNLCYIGESCPSAYLLQCRKVFAKVLGPNDFSDDPDRFTMVETRGLQRLEGNTGQLPNKQYADYLLKTYLNNSNNIVYILDDEVLKRHLEKVYLNPHNVSPKEICILNLVFAIASIYAQVEVSNNLFPFPNELFIIPQVFLESANSILNSTDEDGNLWLVESYLLLFFFYQFTGKRNTAWLRLGSAIRHAQALGLNRKYVNESFKDPSYVLHRRKLFRSVFIMDRLSSIHLGRSMTIHEKDWDDINAFDHIHDFQDRLLKICILSGKILSEVYYNPSVSLKTALYLADELKRHSQENPINPITPENHVIAVDHRYFLPHICHLNATILLSRPFFHFMVLQKLGLVNYDENSKKLVHLESFYQSCVKSSLLIIKIVEYVYHQNIHPFKPLSLISCTFHAGLVIGLLLLLKHKGIDHGIKPDDKINQNSDEMVIQALDSAIKMLHTYGEVDAPSKRYANVLQKSLDVTRNRPEYNRAETYDQLNSLRVKNQENYQNILRFKDWLFPKFDGSTGGSSEYSTGNNSAISDTKQDEFLKDVAGLNNVDATGPQFLDDFLYNVIDSNNASSVNYQYQF